MLLDEEVIRELLAVFRDECYPSYTLEDVVPINRRVEFSLSRAGCAQEFVCEAALFRGTKPILLSYCYRQGSGYSPAVRYHAVEIDAGRVREVRKEIFPIDDIVDQLEFFVVDERRMRRYLEDAALRDRLFDAIEFSLHGNSDDEVLVTLHDIVDVIDAAAYATLRWDETAMRFERVPDGE